MRTSKNFLPENVTAGIEGFCFDGFLEEDLCADIFQDPDSPGALNIDGPSSDGMSEESRLSDDGSLLDGLTDEDSDEPRFPGSDALPVQGLPDVREFPHDVIGFFENCDDYPFFVGFPEDDLPSPAVQDEFLSSLRPFHEDDLDEGLVPIPPSLPMIDPRDSPYPVHSPKKFSFTVTPDFPLGRFPHFAMLTRKNVGGEVHRVVEFPNGMHVDCVTQNLVPLFPNLPLILMRPTGDTKWVLKFWTRVRPTEIRLQLYHEGVFRSYSNTEEFRPEKSHLLWSQQVKFQFSPSSQCEFEFSPDAFLQKGHRLRAIDSFRIRVSRPSLFGDLEFCFLVRKTPRRRIGTWKRDIGPVLVPLKGGLLAGKTVDQKIFPSEDRSDKGGDGSDGDSPPRPPDILVLSGDCEESTSTPSNSPSEILQGADSSHQSTLLESEPVHVVHYRRASDSFFVDEEACEMLCRLEGPLHVISMAGRTKIGNSYLENRFFGPSSDLFQPRKDGCRGFATSGSMNSCTNGIWGWVRVVDSKTVLLLDMEGLDRPDRTPFFEHRLLVLAMILSSTFVFSSLNCIDRNSIALLDYVLQLTRVIFFGDSELRDPNSVEDVQEDAVGNASFSRFVWVVRDFFLDLQGNTATEYMQEQFAMVRSQSPQTNEGSRECGVVSASFREKECFVLPRPCQDEEFLSRIESRPDLVNVKFRRSVFDFVRSTIAKSRPRMKGGIVFVHILRQLVDLLNSKKQLDLDVSFPSLQQRSNLRLIDEIAQTYEQLMRDAIEKKGLPMQAHDLWVIDHRIYWQLYEDVFLKRVIAETGRKASSSSHLDSWGGSMLLRGRIVPKRQKFLDENVEKTKKFCLAWLRERWKPIVRGLGAKKSPYRVSVSQTVTQCLENYDRDHKEILQAYLAAPFAGDAETKTSILAAFCRLKSREKEDMIRMNVAAAEVLVRLLEEKRQYEEVEQVRRDAHDECDSVLNDLVTQRQLFKSQIERLEEAIIILKEKSSKS